MRSQAGGRATRLGRGVCGEGQRQRGDRRFRTHVGYKAVEHPHYYSDLHATILNQLGLDWKKMEYNVFGRTMRLVEEGDGPIKEIIA